MALRTVELAVDELLATGIIDRVVGGREKLLQMRSGHRLAPAVFGLLRAGADFWPALRGELRAFAAKAPTEELLSVAVVGRVARREERLGDAVDLLVLGASREAAAFWMERYHALAEGILARFGVTVRPIGYGIAEAREMWSVRTLAAERHVVDAELVIGHAPLALLSSDRGVVQG